MRRRLMRCRSLHRSVSRRSFLVLHGANRFDVRRRILRLFVRGFSVSCRSMGISSRLGRLRMFSGFGSVRVGIMR